jgi:hypothetical protein
MEFSLLSFYYCTKVFKVRVNFLRIMSDEQDSLKDNKISRRQFIKLVGAGTVVAFGIPSILKNIREALAITTQGSNANNATGAIAAPASNNVDIRPFRVNVPTGWDVPRIARAWVDLMKRLGYTRFVAQGGDWGALITEIMGVQAPPELISIHTNMPGTVPADVWKVVQSGGPAPSGLSGEERRAYEELKFFFYERSGLRTRDGEPSTDAIRNCGFTRRPSRLDARPRRA